MQNYTNILSGLAIESVFQNVARVFLQNIYDPVKTHHRIICLQLCLLWANFIYVYMHK